MKFFILLNAALVLGGCGAMVAPYGGGEQDSTSDDGGPLESTDTWSDDAAQDPGQTDGGTEADAGRRDGGTGRDGGDGIDRGWTVTFGGLEQDWPRAAVISDDGAVFVGGTFRGEADFDPGPGEEVIAATGERDVFILELDARGSLRWVRTIDVGSATDEGVSMTSSPESGVLLTGRFAATVDFDPDPESEELRTAAGENDLFVLSLDRNGRFRWVRTIGGDGDDVGTDLTTTPRGDVLLAGACDGQVDFDPAPEVEELRGVPGWWTMFVLELDGSTGQLEWLSTFEGTGRGWVSAAAALDDGSVVASGRFEGAYDFDLDGFPEQESAGAHDLFLARLDGAGGVLWARTFGQVGEDWATGMTVTDNDAILVTGHFEHGIGFGRDLVVEHESSGFWDAFIASFDLDGERLWSTAYGGDEWDWGSGIALGSDGLLVTGSFEERVAFDPESGDRTLSEGTWDSYLLSVGVDGQYEWVWTFGGRGRDYAEDVVSGPHGEIVLVGNFQQSVDFAPCGGHDVHTAVGGSDAYVTKLLANGCYR